MELQVIIDGESVPLGEIAKLAIKSWVEDQQKKAERRARIAGTKPKVEIRE